MQTLIKMKNKYAQKIEYCLEILLRLPALVFFLFFGIFLVFLSDRQVPATLHSPQVLTPHPHAGQPIRLGFLVDRQRVCDLEYNHIIVDSTGTRFALPDYPTIGRRSIATDDPLTFGFDLPKGMAPGPAVYQSDRHYYCNFTQRWISPVVAQDPDIFFNVEEGP